MSIFSKKVKKSELRCEHRHTIDEHPGCFASGMVKESKKEPELWYQDLGMKIGYLDIETDGLVADFNTMLTWCIKDKGGKVYHDEVTKEDLFNGTTDQRIVKSCIEKLREYKIICTYYGTGFDIPFLRAKALRYDLDFPEYGDLYHFDIYYTVRSKLCISRKSLDNACDYLGIVGKTKIDKDVWRKAKYGDKQAIKGVLEHNIGDVEILEILHDKLTGFRKWIKRSV